MLTESWPPISGLVNSAHHLQNDKFGFSKSSQTKDYNCMGASWEATSVNDRRMLNNEILKKNFRFPIKILLMRMRNIYINEKYLLGKEGLEFQTLSIYI